MQNFWHPSTQQYVLLNICWYVKSYHFHWIEAWSTRLPLIGIKHSNSEKRLITNLKRSSVLQIIIIYCYTCWSQTFCEKSRNHESNQSEKGWPTHAECCSYIRPSSGKSWLVQCQAFIRHLYARVAPSNHVLFSLFLPSFTWKVELLSATAGWSKCSGEEVSEKIQITANRRTPHFTTNNETDWGHHIKPRNVLLMLKYRSDINDGLMRNR